MIKKLNKIVLLLALFLASVLPVQAQNNTSDWFDLPTSDLKELLAINEKTIQLKVVEPTEFYISTANQIDFNGFPTFAIGCCCGITGYYFYVNKHDVATESELKSARLGCVLNSLAFSGLLVGIIYSTYNSNF